MIFAGTTAQPDGGDTCDVTVGDKADSPVLHAYAFVGRDPRMARERLAGRLAAARSNQQAPVTAVPGLGSAAYRRQSTPSEVGETAWDLLVLDGNLLLQLSIRANGPFFLVAPDRTPQHPPLDAQLRVLVTDVLPEVVAGTLRRLATG